MKIREGCTAAEVCTALNILNIDFRVMTPRSAADGYRCIGRTVASVFRIEGERGEAGLTSAIANKLIWQFNNCPTRCDLFSLLYFCRQLYMFRVLTPIIRSSYTVITASGID